MEWVGTTIVIALGNAQIVLNIPYCRDLIRNK